MESRSHEDTELYKVFEDLNDAVKDNLANIKSPLHLGLVILTIAEVYAHRQYLNASQIVESLRISGVAIKPVSITNAFSRAGNKVHRKEIGKNVSYRAMTSGRRLVEKYLDVDPISVLSIEAGKPRTARKVLSSILGSISGEVRVCDPYYGVRSLDALEMISSSCSVKFLTCQSPESGGKLDRAISDFKKENPQIELRLYPEPKLIHDRYIIESDNLLILGHGTKDIGNRESFIITISGVFSKDLVESMITTFDEKWAKSTPI